MSNLRRIRKSRKLTMKQLGEMIGVTESAIGMYETGKRQPSYEVLLKLSEALECSVDDIMREKEEKPIGNDELYEFAEELQIMKDSYSTRSLLKSSKGLTEAQIEIVKTIMAEMRKGNEANY